MAIEYNKFELMKKIIINIFCLITFVALFAGCSKSDVKTYSLENASAYFPNGNLEYSFADNPSDEYMEVDIPVWYTGPISNTDRVIAFDIDKENTTADGSKYQIIESGIKAGEKSGYIKVKLHNDPILEESTFDLVINLKSSADFAVDLMEGELVNKTFSHNKIVISWHNQISRPEWLLKGNFLRYISYTALYIDPDDNSIYGEQNEAGTRRKASGAYRSNGLYSRNFMLILKELWPPILNVNGMYGTDAETLEKYPMVNINMGGYSIVLLHALEQYVANYNLKHPGEPLRHSEDAVILKSNGDIASVSISGTPYQLIVKGCPPIMVNPYNL